MDRAQKDEQERLARAYRAAQTQDVLRDEAAEGAAMIANNNQGLLGPKVDAQTMATQNAAAESTAAAAFESERAKVMAQERLYRHSLLVGGGAPAQASGAIAGGPTVLGAGHAAGPSGGPTAGPGPGEETPAPAGAAPSRQNEGHLVAQQFSERDISHRSQSDRWESLVAGSAQTANRNVPKGEPEEAGPSVTEAVTVALFSSITHLHVIEWLHHGKDMAESMKNPDPAPKLKPVALDPKLGMNPAKAFVPGAQAASARPRGPGSGW